MSEERITPVHLEEFLKPMGMGQNQLALRMGISARRINEIVLGRRSITADTALRLAKCLGTTPQFWMRLQTNCDLELARDVLGDTLERDVRPVAV